jgi:hypothetical protein
MCALAPLAASQDLTLDALKQLRAEAAQRDRRIVFNNDGNEPVYYVDEATPKALLDNRTTALADTQVDTIVYCTWSSGFSMFTHDTKVGEVFTNTSEEPDKGPGSGFSKNKTQAFVESGNDPLDIMVDFCKTNDIEVFWSMRMNDVHDAWGAWYSPHLMPQIKRDHPEWMIGTKQKRPKNGGWTAIDFAVPEVRDLAFRLFEEVCTNYDVDGVEMDFFRHLNYFRGPANGEPATQAELDMMTGLVRRIRAMTEEVGLERGRPILLSVRLPDSVAFCRTMGLDIERWLREGLIDIMAVTGYYRLNPWETSVALGKQYNVPVWACLSESRIKDKEAVRLRAGLEAYRGRAANVWASGADSVYLFNYFRPTSALWSEIGTRETLGPLSKTYFAGVRGYGQLDFWFEGGARFGSRDLLHPGEERVLTPGSATTVTLYVGEASTAQTEATLRLRVKDIAEEAVISATFNDQVLGAGRANEQWIEYTVPADAIRAGANTVAIALEVSGQGAPTVDDIVLRVE